LPADLIFTRESSYAFSAS